MGLLSPGESMVGLWGPKPQNYMQVLEVCAFMYFSEERVRSFHQTLEELRDCNKIKARQRG